jgi:hypothetical protein
MQTSLRTCLVDLWALADEPESLARLVRDKGGRYHLVALRVVTKYYHIFHRVMTEKIVRPMLIESIKEDLAKIKNRVVAHPGHGDDALFRAIECVTGALESLRPYSSSNGRKKDLSDVTVLDTRNVHELDALFDTLRRVGWDLRKVDEEEADDEEDSEDEAEDDEDDEEDDDDSSYSDEGTVDDEDDEDSE